MVSLTPKSRAEEVTGQAMNEGLTNGILVLIPSIGALFAALQNPKFRQVTNWQSRTAMVIMPAFFVFTLTSEHKMAHRMGEVALETEHSIKSVEWAEREQQRRLHQSASEAQKEAELRALYRQAILESKVRVVPGNSLALYQQGANYIQSNPFKVLGTIGVPSVAYIFYSRQGKAHLNMQMKLLHTRVYGQFTIVCTMLSVMAVKELMDRSGRYMSELEVDQRVEDMVQTRKNMIDQLEYLVLQDKKQQEESRRKPRKQQEQPQQEQQVQAQVQVQVQE